MIVLLEATPLAAKKESDQAHILRTLLSEGRIVHETVLTDDDGPYLERIEKEGPTGLLTCTVLDTLDEELLTRLVIVGIDGGPEQTRQVLAVAAAAAEGEDPPDFTSELEVWHELFRWMAYQPTRVVVPFATDIQTGISVAHTRTRRDFKQLISMIKASALLHRVTREVDDQGRVIANIGDYRHALAAIGPGIDEASDRKPRIEVSRLVALIESRSEAPATVGPGKKFAPRPGAVRTVTITTTELAEALNIPRATAHRWVKVAVEEGYLINHTERSRRPMQLEVQRGCSGDPTPAVLPSVEEVQKTYATRGPLKRETREIVKFYQYYDFESTI